MGPPSPPSPFSTHRTYTEGPVKAGDFFVFKWWRETLILNGAVKNLGGPLLPHFSFQEGNMSSNGPGQGHTGSGRARVRIQKF